jgi:acyl phosphate:glycerol-3-phosphate acyltransferase
VNALGAGGLVVGAYLAGGLPSGVLLGLVFAGTDIRRQGSGSTGSTNALRVLRWRIALAVLILDVAKGLAPILIGRAAGGTGWPISTAAVAAVVGHCWSPYIRFTGGKGVATGAGASAGLWPWVVIFTVPALLLIVVRTRLVSLANLVAVGLATLAATIAALAGGLPWSSAAAELAIAAIIVWRHRGNIRRLRNGTERRLGDRADPVALGNRPGFTNSG